DPIIHQANLNMLGNLAILGMAALLALSLAWVFGNLVLISPLVGWWRPPRDSAWARWTPVRACPTVPMNWGDWPNPSMIWRRCSKLEILNERERKKLWKKLLPRWRSACKSAPLS